MTDDGMDENAALSNADLEQAKVPWKRDRERLQEDLEKRYSEILRVDLLQRLHSRSDAALAASGAKRCQGPLKEMAQLTMLQESTCSHLDALFTSRVFVLGCIRAAFLLCKACNLKNLVFAYEMWSLKPQNPLSYHRHFPSSWGSAALVHHRPFTLTRTNQMLTQHVCGIPDWLEEIISRGFPIWPGSSSDCYLWRLMFATYDTMCHSICMIQQSQRYFNFILNLESSYCYSIASKIWEGSI